MTIPVVLADANIQTLSGCRRSLERLLKTGAIPLLQGPRLDDLLEYRRRQRSAAELALADMVADTEHLGPYDADPREREGPASAGDKVGAGDGLGSVTLRASTNRQRK